jgi:hypothetical protein
VPRIKVKGTTSDASGGEISELAFKEAAEGLRWSEKSLACAHAVLVKGERPADVGRKHDVTTGHASVLARRFRNVAEGRRGKRVTPEQFLREKLPLLPFRNALKKLAKLGVSTDLLLEYLRRNGIVVSSSELKAFLKTSGIGR